MDKSSRFYHGTNGRFAVYEREGGKFELGIWRKPIGAAVADFWMSDITEEELGELADIIWGKLSLDKPVKGKPEEVSSKRETLTPIALTSDDLRQIESNTFMNVVKLAQALAVKQWVEAKEDAA